MKHPVSCFRLLSKFVPIRFVSVALLLLSCLVFWSERSLADEQSRAVRLSYVHGTVRILMGDQTEFQKAYANMPIIEGSRLQAGNDGRAELQFEDGSVARLTPNSSLAVTQLRTDSDGLKTSELEFLGGLAYFELQPQSNSSQTSVVYQQNRITATTFAIFRVNADNPPGELGVLSGDLHLAGGSGFTVDAHSDEQVRFDAGNAAGYYLSQGLSRESWDQWNNDRDSSLNKEAERQTAATASTSDPNNPAWSDLDAYGNWYDVDGYGQVWTPAGAGSDWDPYGSGYWAMYPGYGYTWVSAYPWGYLPYRCGAWNYFNNFGWGWIPGGCGSGFIGTSIVVWNTPPGWIYPRRPIINPPVGVVAGTREIVPVQRGGVSRYKPQPIYGAGGVARPVTIGGRSVNPLPPIRISNGFNGTTGNRTDGTVVVGRTGITRPDRPVAITPGPGQSGSSTWNTVRPQPGGGIRPGQGSGNTEIPRMGSPVVTAPVQHPQPVSPMPRTVAPPIRITPPQQSAPAPSAPRIAPAPVIAPPRITIQPPSSAPRMSSPAPAPRMEAPRMSAPAPSAAPRSAPAPSGRPR